MIKVVLGHLLDFGGLVAAVALLAYTPTFFKFYVKSAFGRRHPLSIIRDPLTASSDVDSNSMQVHKFVYIVRVHDVERVAAIVGKLEDAPNWEATKLGLHVEVEVSRKQCVDLERLASERPESVSVHDTKQHTLTDHERYVHEVMGWSKAAMERKMQQE